MNFYKGTYQEYNLLVNKNNIKSKQINQQNFYDVPVIVHTITTIGLQDFKVVNLYQCDVCELIKVDG